MGLTCDLSSPDLGYRSSQAEVGKGQGHSFQAEVRAQGRGRRGQPPTARVGRPRSAPSSTSPSCGLWAPEASPHL